MGKKIFLVITIVLILTSSGCNKKNKELNCTYDDGTTMFELKALFKNDLLYEENYNITYYFYDESEAQEFYETSKNTYTIENGFDEFYIQGNNVILKSKRKITNESKVPRKYKVVKQKLEKDYTSCK